MDQNNVELKRGNPFYIAGIAITAAGFFFYSMPSWYYTSMVPIAFIAAGTIFYLGWLTHMGKDNKEFDNGCGGGGRIFLDKPA